MSRDAHASVGAAGPLDRLRRHRYGPLVEVLVDEPSFLVKPAFGCLSCYVHGRLVLVLADRRPPWQGLLVPTRHEHQAALRAEIPALTAHPVLAKWLYVRETAAEFEEVAARLVALVCADDPRLGVEPMPRRRSASGRGAVTKRRRPSSS
jgi:hypothetical protein